MAIIMNTLWPFASVIPYDDDAKVWGRKIGTNPKDLYSMICCSIVMGVAPELIYGFVDEYEPDGGWDIE